MRDFKLEGQDYGVDRVRHVRRKMEIFQSHGLGLPQAVTVPEEKVKVAMAAKNSCRLLLTSGVPEVHALWQHDDTVPGEVSDSLFAQPLMVGVEVPQVATAAADNNGILVDLSA